MNLRLFTKRPIGRFQDFLIEATACIRAFDPSGRNVVTRANRTHFFTSGHLPIKRYNAHLKQGRGIMKLMHKKSLVVLGSFLALALCWLGTAEGTAQVTVTTPNNTTINTWGPDG